MDEYYTYKNILGEVHEHVFEKVERKRSDLPVEDNIDHRSCSKSLSLDKTSQENGRHPEEIDIYTI